MQIAFLAVVLSTDEFTASTIIFICESCLSKGLEKLYWQKRVTRNILFIENARSSDFYRFLSIFPLLFLFCGILVYLSYIVVVC